MILSKQGIIDEFELKPALCLDEIIAQRKQEEYLTGRDTFLIDLGFGTEFDMAIYPVTSKAHIKTKFFTEKKTLVLKGTEFRFLADIRNINYLILDEVISKNIKFREKGFKGTQRIWMFMPQTQGWQYYENILVPNEYNTCNREVP